MYNKKEKKNFDLIDQNMTTLTEIEVPTTSGALLLGSTTKWQTLPVSGTSGQVLMSSGTNPQYVSLSGGVTSLSSTGGITLASTLVVSNKTASYTILTTDTRTVFTNAGSTSTVTLTLPTPSVGLQYTFICIGAHKFEIRVANTVSQMFKSNSSGSALSGPYLYFVGSSTSIGASIKIMAITTTIWQIINMMGTWTVSLVA